MNEPSNLFTQISIDLKKFRIRVHKESLHLIGDPKYIQFLVNMNSRLVAIRAVEKEQVDLQTHRVDQTRMESDFSFEIYSRPFIERLRKEFDCLGEGNSYRLTGAAIQSERIAVFSLDSLQKIDI
ncbi:MAG: hypothetical protein A2Y15_06470 [Clostridiales bacterium GWF2_36_10]|nr:MAG: hypothetical protein A2Y15_06470 [Clostridiales bacterium GWF2_36_10]HAN20644.1 hypothetical protein [Clostridiales bacterium]